MAAYAKALLRDNPKSYKVQKRLQTASMGPLILIVTGGFNLPISFITSFTHARCSEGWLTKPTFCPQ